VKVGERGEEGNRRLIGLREGRRRKVKGGKRRTLKLKARLVTKLGWYC